MGAMASEITSLTIVYWTVYSGADQWKHQSSASLAFVRGIHRGPVNSPHKWPVTRKMFSFDDVIMINSAPTRVITLLPHCWTKYMIESEHAWYQRLYGRYWLDIDTTLSHRIDVKSMSIWGVCYLGCHLNTFTGEAQGVSLVILSLF